MEINRKTKPVCAVISKVFSLVVLGFSIFSVVFHGFPKFFFFFKHVF